MTNSVNPFNNQVETGLRILCILNEAYPDAFDIQTLVYLDYLTVHSGDVDSNEKSLHPAVPFRTGELLVRSVLIQEGLELLINKTLIDKRYSNNGIEFCATEESTPFIESLEEEYSMHLREKAKWVISNFASLKHNELKAFLDKRTESINREFNIEILE
ncbi:MAG: threonine transporter [Bacteroidota bacterium]|nr:threonine transporter [Bacteroidota bacterium]